MDAAGSVLVVDDDLSVNVAVTLALQSRYEVSSARTGSEAAELICRQHFDLILLDHLLPDCAGTELLGLVKRFFPSISVILMTGHGSEEVAMAALRNGARDYLQKPISLSDLLARVDAIFQVRQAGGERRREAYGRLVHPAFEGPAEQDEDATRSLLRAIHYIDANFAEPLTLDQVARIAGMSKFHFCRKFGAFTGCSFREFLMRRRITRAKELLGDRARSIGEIGHAVGFLDQAHFTRVFRRFENALPSKFRQLLAGRTASAPGPGPGPEKVTEVH
jgi:YesN/AraC family two-component response regulator